MIKIYEYNEWKDDPYLVTYSLSEANAALKEIPDPLLVRHHVGKRRYVLQLMPEGSYSVKGVVYPPIAQTIPKERINTPTDMKYVWFDCPEWKNNKESSVRPGIVRNSTDKKMIIYPITSKFHTKSDSVYIPDLGKASWCLVGHVSCLNVSRIIEYIKDVPKAIVEELAYWEEALSDLITDKEQELQLS